MSSSANVVSDNFVVPSEAIPVKIGANGEVLTQVVKDENGNVIQWRMPVADAYKNGVLWSRSYNAKEKKWSEPRETVFSLSAGISERFNDEFDVALDDFITDGKEKHSSDNLPGDFEAPTRAQYIRMLVAEAIGYDIALEPVREGRGAGMKEYHERIKAKTTAYDSIAKLALEDPELAAALAARGIVLPS